MIMEENKTYEIGDIVSVTVTGIQNYGAFAASHCPARRPA